MDDHYTVLSAKIKQEHSYTDIKIDQILEHNAKQNGWLSEHTEAIEGLQGVSIEFKRHKRRSVVFMKQWKLWIVLTLATLYGLHKAFEAISFSQIIEFIKSLIN